MSFCACTTTEFSLGIYPDRQLAAFGGYQVNHLKTIEGFDGEIDWDYLAQDLQEPRTQGRRKLPKAGWASSNMGDTICLLWLI